MKKLTRIVAVIATLIFIPVVPAWAADYTPLGVDEAAGMIGVYVKDESLGASTNSLVIDEAAGRDSQGLGKFCPSLSTGGCELTPTSQLRVLDVLPNCGEVTENCLESVEIYMDGEQPAPAKVLKTFPGVAFPSTPGLNNPAVGMPSLWQASGVPNAAGSEKYVVSPGIDYRVRGNTFTIVNFGVIVRPVVDYFAPSFKPFQIQTRMLNGKPSTNGDNGDPDGSNKCAATDTGYCAKITDFAPGTHVRVTLRLSNTVTGWLHGRVSKPIISVTPLDAKNNKLVIDAEPVVVPEMYVPVNYANQPSDIQSELDRYGYSGGIHSSSHTWRTYLPESPGAMKFVQFFGPLAKDTAVNTTTAWNLASFGTDAGADHCLSDSSKLIGVVTTNAMTYDGGVPYWDGTKLNYKVAGLHFMPDGKTPVEGTYDLSMRSETARCLYGFSSAPISATISVTGANGENKVATTVVTEKNGWLHLAAYGFNFSSPTISVKLSQAKAPAVKTTITCVKGKLTKKVTAVNAACPAGYKKK